MSAPHSKSSSYAVSLDGARQCATSYYFVNVQSNHIAAHLLLPCVDSSQGMHMPARASGGCRFVSPHARLGGQVFASTPRR